LLNCSLAWNPQTPRTNKISYEKSPSFSPFPFPGEKNRAKYSKQRKEGFSAKERERERERGIMNLVMSVKYQTVDHSPSIQITSLNYMWRLIIQKTLLREGKQYWFMKTGLGKQEVNPFHLLIN